MKFGTDGIRGPAGPPPIDPASAVRIGRAAAKLAARHGGSSVLVARDTRPSGAVLALAVEAGVRAEGAEALSAGVLPTPALAVALDAGLAPVGVMLTASHNPHSDNGFKLLGPGGRKLGDDETAQVEAWLADPSTQLHDGGSRTVHADALDGWLTRLAALDTTPLAGRHIAFDLAAGACEMARPWLERRSFTAHFVEGDRINDGVGSEYPERLAALVRERGCTAGIAVDGDGDRCLLVDENGSVVPGDALTWFLARVMGVDALAVTVMSTAALEPALPEVRVYRTPVGDRHLQRAMVEHGLTLAAEESGHVLFADHPGGDGLFTGLRALTLAGPSLAEAIAPFQPWPRKTGKIPVRHKAPLHDDPLIQALIREGEADLGTGGRVFLRYSGTEPVLRVLVEGSDPEMVARVHTRVMEALEDWSCR